MKTRNMYAVAAIGALACSATIITSRPNLHAAPENAPVVKAAPKSDGTARQTAHPWTGSPYGPNNDFEGAERAKELHIAQVMDDLGLKNGSVVADIGAGGGWFSMLAARRVGTKGRVYAEDILPKFTRFIGERAKREKMKNVRPILGTFTDPKLPKNALDAVLILNAYHEFEQPLGMLNKIRAAMKPGARLAFIERDDEQLRQQARDAFARSGQIKHRVDERPDGNEFTDDHRLALPIVEREAAKAGFVKVTDYDLENDHYVLIVRK